MIRQSIAGRTEDTFIRCANAIDTIPLIVLTVNGSQGCFGRSMDKFKEVIRPKRIAFVVAISRRHY